MENPFDLSQITTDDIKKVIDDDNYLKPNDVNEDWLIKLGFTKYKSLILDSFYISITNSDLEYKVLSITFEQGNQYIFIRQGKLY